MVKRATTEQPTAKSQVKLRTHFSDFFDVQKSTLDDTGAFNISLINDLPLFIDPFLLFNSQKPTYRGLHDEIINYLRFLRDKATGSLHPGLIGAWYTFPEIKQTWLGFSQVGNAGHGLGRDFAMALHTSLHSVFADFGSEKLTTGSHLEKLCLVRGGVGRDTISDFTTNLIRGFLLEYTQSFALDNIDAGFRRRVTIPRVRFNYDTESWESGSFELPWLADDYVILTPKDILTKDDTWINRPDMVNDFDQIVDAMPNEELRAQLNNYLAKALPKDAKKKDIQEAIASTIREFPEFIEYYIRFKEENGDRATSISQQRVAEVTQQFVLNVRQFVSDVGSNTAFYQIAGNTVDETRERIEFLKDMIENKGCHQIFYINGQPVRRESDLHIMFRMTWFATPSDVSREVNDGRGPADFKISRGAFDKTIIEFKLASNTQLKRNLQAQAELYKKASDASSALKVILYFSAEELTRVESILKEIGLYGHRDVILIDGRRDNKPSASKA
jgi:hypothetical protein